MAIRSINDVEFETFGINGIPALITDERFDKSTIPEGYYAYDVRGSDYDYNRPATIEPFVYVNYVGTVITRTPIELNQGEGKDKYKSLGDDWSYGIPISEFGDKFSYCPKDNMWKCIA